MDTPKRQLERENLEEDRAPPLADDLPIVHEGQRIWQGLRCGQDHF